MTPEEKQKNEFTLQYLLWRLKVLQLEHQILLIEHDSLIAAATKISDFQQSDIKPLFDEDLRFEDIYWKWSEQSMRYHAQAKGIRATLDEKVLQINEKLKSAKDIMRDLGYDVSALADSLTEDSSPDEWDDIITGVEDLSKKSEE